MSLIFEDTFFKSEPGTEPQASRTEWKPLDHPDSGFKLSWLVQDLHANLENYRSMRVQLLIYIKFFSWNNNFINFN